LVTFTANCYWPQASALDLPKKWEQGQANFKFVPMLSEPTPEDHWQGRTGFLHQTVMEDYADLEDYQVYACGSLVMVEAAHQAFATQRKLPIEEFYSDAFTFSSKPKV
jgi:CDP-4-dehydro-6-deoxyglucose reductase